MHRKLFQVRGLLFLCAIAFTSTTQAQEVRVEVGKRTAAIPKNCESVLRASIESEVDIPSLVKEAICKGSGDMLSDYTYVMTSAKRTIDKKGRIKEESTTYEVYMPTLKSGTRGRGILLVTSRNGIPVPAAELEKERTQAGERLEKQDNKIERQAPLSAEANTSRLTGLMPVGMYPRTRVTRSAFGMSKADVALIVQTYLEKCTLTFLRRELVEGRMTLVFNFVPGVGSQFNDNEKYIAKLHGTIWIDAEDRIVSRLAGWPSSDSVTVNAASSPGSTEKAPAIYVEMCRLPDGVWLSKVVRLNGADYRSLFDGVNSDGTTSYSEYKLFTTEAKDVQLGAPTRSP